MNDSQTIDAAIEYTPPEPDSSPYRAAPGGGSRQRTSFSLVAMQAGRPVQYWVAPPTGFADADYRLGWNFGDELARAAADKPEQTALLLTNAMIALPASAADYKQMLRGLFDRFTAAVANASVVTELAGLESIELTAKVD